MENKHFFTGPRVQAQTENQQPLSRSLFPLRESNHERGKRQNSLRFHATYLLNGASAPNYLLICQEGESWQNI